MDHSAVIVSQIGHLTVEMWVKFECVFIFGNIYIGH